MYFLEPPGVHEGFKRLGLGGRVDDLVACGRVVSEPGRPPCSRSSTLAYPARLGIHWFLPLRL